MGMAQECPEMFGNSIYVYADVTEEAYNEGGVERIGLGLKLIEWSGSDLVDDPAATNGLFFDNKKETNNRLIMNLKQVTKEMLTFLKEFSKKAKEAKVFDIDLTLANGDMITVVTEGESPAVGDEVRQKTSDGQEADKPLADGEYLLKDEKTLVVEGGKIKEIREKEKEPNNEGEDEEFARVVIDTLNALVNKVEEMEKEFSRMKKIQSKFEIDNPRGVSQEQGGNGSLLDLEKIRKRLGRA